MRNFKLAIAILAALATTAAFGQGMKGDMKHGMVEGIQVRRPMAKDPMMAMMHGLSASEKKTAMDMWTKMTPAQKAVMKKVHMNFMKAGHDKKMMPKDQKGMMTMATNGLSASEKSTLMAMHKKMTPAQMSVMKKIHANTMHMGGMSMGKPSMTRMNKPGM